MLEYYFPRTLIFSFLFFLLVSNDDYMKDDCICIFILTHGEAKGLIWALDACYPINIYEETLSSIQTLNNKPKLIFVQVYYDMLHGCNIRIHNI
jgi:hypothetical protein